MTKSPKKGNLKLAKFNDVQISRYRSAGSEVSQREMQYAVRISEGLLAALETSVRSAVVAIISQNPFDDNGRGQPIYFHRAAAQG